MTNIRAGDIVTVEILVEEVQPYSEEGPQVRGRMLPHGAKVGWLIPTEAKVTLNTATIKVYDEVWLDKAHSLKGEILYRTTHDGDTWLWVKPDKGTPRSMKASELERI